MGRDPYRIHFGIAFIVLVLIAISFEPIRSGFALSDQSCGVLPTYRQLLGAIFNFKHIIGYGLICLLGFHLFDSFSKWGVMAGVLLFSGILELQQSFFETGHCRAWDMIPNFIAVALALGADHVRRGNRI